jgi:hypothetical protein
VAAAFCHLGHITAAVFAIGYAACRSHRGVEAIQYRLGHLAVTAEWRRHRDPLCAGKCRDAVENFAVRQEPRRDDQPAGTSAPQEFRSVEWQRINRALPPPLSQRLDRAIQS